MTRVPVSRHAGARLTPCWCPSHAMRVPVSRHAGARLTPCGCRCLVPPLAAATVGRAPATRPAVLPRGTMKRYSRMNRQPAVLPRGLWSCHATLYIRHEGADSVGRGAPTRVREERWADCGCGGGARLASGASTVNDSDMALDLTRIWLASTRAPQLLMTRIWHWI